MPDTSCRKCGGLLTKFSLCAECRKPVQQICTSCGVTTLQIFHKDCFYHVDSFQTNVLRDIFNESFSISEFDDIVKNKRYLRHTQC